jgi:predicted O-methyltransferase YrrM
MIVLIIVLFLAILILFTSYNRNSHRYKQKGLFSNWPIPTISLDQFDPIFQTNEYGPTLDTTVHFIGRGDLNVPGGTSDSEAWVLSVLAKKANTIFEFGTCTGKTAYLFAKNSTENSHVITLTLSPNQITDYKNDLSDNMKSTKEAKKESVFVKFLYSGTPEEKKITQVFCDSKHFNESSYAGKMDLIFVDGSHAFSYVMSDSEKAFKMVAPNGIIIWHDYRGPIVTRDVFKALNDIAKNRKLVHLKGTSLVVFKA